MSTDTKEAEARARAHAVIGTALACGGDMGRASDHSGCCDRLVALLRSQEEERDALRARFLAWRGIEYGSEPCKTCGGAGQRSYASTSTWRGGIGGQAITSDVCDKCWGSGDEARPGTNLSRLDAEVSALRARVERAEGALRVRTVERDEWKHALMRIAKPNTLRNGPDYCETCLHDLAGERPCSSPCPGFIARAALSEPTSAGKGTPTVVPTAKVFAVETFPPVTEETRSCGGCGGHSAAWQGWRRPDAGQCWWVWDVANQIWLFACKDDETAIPEAKPPSEAT